MTLREKLIKVYDAIDHLEKSGRNQKQNYSFIKAHQVLRAVRDEFSKLGVYAEPNFEYLGTYDIATHSGGKMHASTVKATVRLWDKDSQETMVISGLGDGADSGDKGIFKAQTGALRTALRYAFLIPDEADPEADETVDYATDYTDAPPPFSPPPRRAAPFREELPPPAEIPSVPTTLIAQNATATQIAMPAKGGTMPTDEQLSAFGNKLRALADDLSAKGGLKASRGLPIQRKVLAYLLSLTDASDARQISLAQFETFFKIVDSYQNDPTKLAEIVNSASIKGT